MSAASPIVSIRPLRGDEVDAYRELRLYALRDAPRALSASEHEDAALTHEQMAERACPKPPGLSLGAFAGDELVGIAAYAPEPRAKEAHKAFLVGVFVRPEFRKAKVGRRLVEAVIDHARSLGVILHCWVAADNARARTLYLDLGFVPYGLIKDSLLVEGQYVDEEMLSLDLRPRKDV